MALGRFDSQRERGAWGQGTIKEKGRGTTITSSEIARRNTFPPRHWGASSTTQSEEKFEERDNARGTR